MTVESHEVLGRALTPITVVDDPRIQPVSLSSGLERWQRGASLVAPAFDAVTCLAATLAVGAGAATAAMGSGAILAALLMGGAYGDRSPLAAQGLRWITRAPMLAAAATGAVLAAARMPGYRTVAASVCVLVALAASRLLLGVMVSTRRRAGELLHATVVIGTNESAERAAERLRLFPECGLRVTQVLDPTDDDDHKFAVGLLAQGLVQDVVVVDGLPVGRLAELLAAAGTRRVRFAAVHSTPSLLGARLHGRVGDLRTMPLGRTMPAHSERVLKRAIDVTGSALMLLVSAPLVAVAAFLVRRDGGPALFRQQRVGRDGREFVILKLRTMVPDADRVDMSQLATPPTDGLLFKLPDDPRVTTVGEHLRRLAIDELPQLWNVLRGDMSLVGPRPLAVNPEAFDERAAHRHAVRPGITGPWQVSGGNALRFADMVDMDVAYAATWSIRRDVELLLRTVATVVIRRAPY